MTVGIAVGLIIPHHDGTWETETAPSIMESGIPQPLVIGRWAGDDGIGMAMIASQSVEGERNLAGERVFAAFWGNDPATITKDDAGEAMVIYGRVGFVGLKHREPVSFTEEHAATLAPMLEKLRQDTILKQFEQDLLDTEITELESLL